jgi:hypothetical protein
MKSDDLVRFATDLRTLIHGDAVVGLSPHPTGLNVLHIAGVDFFFRADGSGYDGWGMALSKKGVNLSPIKGRQPGKPD